VNRPSCGSRADLEAALGKVNGKNVNVSHVLRLLQRNAAPVRHHTMRGEGGIHPINSNFRRSTMWTDTTRALSARAGLALPSDLTDGEGAMPEPFFPLSSTRCVRASGRSDGSRRSVWR